MKKDEITIGGTYTAKVSDRVVPVRIDRENARGGWDATNLVSGRPIRIKSAQRLRGATGAAGGTKAAKAETNAETKASAPEVAADAPEKASGKAQAKAAKKTTAKAKAEKKPKAPKADKVDKGMSCLDAAAEVLKPKKEPMQCKALIEAMAEKGLWKSDAPTPAATLYSAILREIQKKGSEARFTKTERGHFALNA